MKFFKMRLLWNVKTADSTTVVRKFGHFLSMIEAGQSVRITKHGRPVARLVPDHGFMSGQEFAQWFADYRADAVDRAAATVIEKNIAQLDAATDDALAH